MINRDGFFPIVRAKLFGGAMAQGQVDGVNRILDEWDRRALTDLRFLAYMLATVLHETAEKMQPIEEMGGEAYLKSKQYYPWVGRGLVQVTWAANYAKFGVTNPDDMLKWPAALKALFDGMLQGVFTGKKLHDYFNEAADDPVGARRIINGTDRASLIAGYHNLFHSALTASVSAQPAKPAWPGPVQIDSQTAPITKPPIVVAPKQTWGDWFKSVLFARKS